jgi:hypothetical protein
MKFGKRVDFRQMRVESAYKCATLSHDLATGLCVAGLVCLDLKKWRFIHILQDNGNCLAR